MTVAGEAVSPSVQRARRFVLALPVRYRRRGDVEWSPGLSVNISRTGLLFETDPPAPSCGESIAFLIHLQSDQGEPGCEARCTGRIVRVVPPSAECAAAAIAATIDEYVLAPGPAASEQPENPGGR